MAEKITPPIGVNLTSDIERRPGTGGEAFRARVRWFDPETRKRRSRSETLRTAEAAQSWIESLEALARQGVDPAVAMQTLAEYGESVMPLALRGLESKTSDP